MYVIWSCEEFACSMLGSTRSDCIAICPMGVVAMFAILLGVAVTIWIIAIMQHYSTMNK